jgi:hypothetical protein
MMAVGSHAQCNPIFLVCADSPNPHYDVLPRTVRNMCRRGLSNYKDPFQVFAYLRIGDNEYYAEWGYITRRDLEEYDRASLLMIHGNVCKVWDIEDTLVAVPPQKGYSGTASEDGLPGPGSPTENTPLVRYTVFRSAKEENLFREFVRDAIQRAIKAYGGVTPFKAKACSPKVETQLSDYGYPIVLQELKNYCTNVQ